MALLWEKRSDGVHYEVRSAGKTLRLYSNGVLHTQYNPSRLLTGSVWDLLLLGTLGLPAERVRRVLLLGVGGGAVVRQILALYPQAEITGVELNPVHLTVARRFFGLRDRRVQLHADNAINWLAMFDGEHYDLIIDDLFGERGGQPCRAVPADADWLDLLATHLRPDGVLVMNFVDAREVRDSDWRHGSASARRFPTALSLATPTCQNRVVIFLPRHRAISVRSFGERVISEPALVSPLLRYRARLLAPRAN